MLLMNYIIFKSNIVIIYVKYIYILKGNSCINTQLNLQHIMQSYKNTFIYISMWLIINIYLYIIKPFLIGNYPLIHLYRCIHLFISNIIIHVHLFIYISMISYSNLQ